MTRIEVVDAAYPDRLRGPKSPPSPLWVRGRLPRADERTLAVVGSRAATGAGCECARGLVSAAARDGWTIVSGGAYGIDAAAHEAALAAGGVTFVVLGCGVDVAYPDRHVDLFARASAQGGVISEHAPGTQPRARHFPARNRIIVALADVVLVVEAAERSGALITARLAQKAGKRLLVVPGTPGTDHLMREAARPVKTADDLRDALAGRPAAVDWNGPDTRPGASAGPLSVLMGALRQSADTPAGLARRLDLPMPEVLAALTQAELEGLVHRMLGGQYEVSRGC